MVSPIEGRQRLRDYLAGFQRAVLAARADLERYFSHEIGMQSRRAIANVMHDRIVFHLRSIFDDDPHVLIIKRRGLWLMYIGGHSLFKMKKLDKNLQSRNISTKQTMMFNDQQGILDGMPSELDHL